MKLEDLLNPLTTTYSGRLYSSDSEPALISLQTKRQQGQKKDTTPLPESIYTRVPKACTHCRREKSRCDLERPCRCCIKRGREDECVDGCHFCRKFKKVCDNGRPCMTCVDSGLDCLDYLVGSCPTPPVKKKLTQKRKSGKVKKKKKVHDRKLDLSSSSSSDASNSPKPTTTSSRRKAAAPSSKRHMKREEVKPDSSSSSSSSISVPSNRHIHIKRVQRACSRSRSNILRLEHEEELSCAHTSRNNVQCNIQHKHCDGSVVGCPTCSSRSDEIGKDQDMELARSTSSESTSESCRGEEDETSISPITPIGSLRSLGLGGAPHPFGGTQMSPYTYYSPLPSVNSFDTPPPLLGLGIDFNPYPYAYTRSPVYVRDLSSPVSSAFSNESLTLYMSTSSIRSTHMLY